MLESFPLLDNPLKGVAEVPVPYTPPVPTFQSHGVVCVVRLPTGEIADISSNAGAWFGQSAAQLVGKPLRAALGDAATTLLDDLASSGERFISSQVHAKVDGVTRRLAVRARHCGVWAVVEIEADDEADKNSPAIDWLRYTADLNRFFLDHATVEVLARRAVQSAHRIIGFERNLLWRFGMGSDEVIAEQCNAGIASLEGLHFSRDEALRRGLDGSYPGRIHCVADLSAPHVHMHDASVWMTEVEAARGVSLAILRCASHPGHASQLGALAFIRAGIWIGDRLWGMIECLNTTARRFSREARGALPLLVQMFARELAIVERHNTDDASLSLREHRSRIFEAMRRSGASFAEASATHASALLDPVDASGAVLVLDGRVSRYGCTPEGEALTVLLDWLRQDNRLARGMESAPFATDRLSSLHPPAASYASIAAGILAAPLTSASGDCIVWMRAAAKQEIVWGAAPGASCGALPVPWKEVVDDRALAWRSADLAIAREFDSMRRAVSLRADVAVDKDTKDRRPVLPERPLLSFWIIDANETVTFARGEGVPVHDTDDGAPIMPTNPALINPAFINPFVGKTLSAIFDRDPSGAVLLDAYRRGLAGQHYRYQVALRGRHHDASTEPVRDADGCIVGVAAFSIDITGKQATDAALAASHARIDRLLRMSSDWECEVDREGRFVYSSGSIFERFGIAPDRYLGKKLGSLDFVRYPPDDFLRFVEAARAQRSFRNLRARLVSGSGEEIILSTNAEPLFEDSGAFTGYLGMVRDVSVEARAEAALAAGYARIDRLLSLSSDFQWEINRAGRIVHVSAPSASLFGTVPERLIGALFAESQVIRFMPGHCENFRRAQRARAPFRDLRMSCVDPVGNDAILAVSAEPTFDANGEFSGYLGMMRDVTREHEAVAALAASEARYRSVVDALAEGIMIRDVDNRTVAINDAACEMLGVRREDVVGVESVVWPGVVDEKGAPVSPEQYPSQVALRLGRESDKVVHGVGMRGAATRWISASTRLLRDPRNLAVTGVVVSTRDVTDQKTGQERLAYLAEHDVLTGLANQTRFCADVDSLLRRAGTPSSCALLVFDLRQFGAVNASLGHAFGDRLLCACAARMNRLPVEGSQRAVAVARIVGDQFAVLIETDGRERSVAFAEQLLLMSKRPFHVDETEIHLDASIGIALGPEDGGDSAALLKHAHLALADAETRDGQGYEFFTSALATAPRERLALDSSLRRALKRGEFVLHYQPQVDARSGRITGMEALLRWHSPERGMVPPNAFIGLMEDSGLIVQVGEWVMTAVSQLKAWRDAGFNDLTMSVNVSPRRFQDRNLAESTEAILDLYGTPPGCVEIEITENVTAKDPEHALQLLRVFERLGMRLAIDDLGTGYSNLAALKRFPMQRLKIDQSFVSEMLTDADNAAIVRAIVAMATSLRLDLIAEGVETVEQLAFLRALGCHTYQGYLFARPLWAAAATQMLLEHAASFA